MHARRWSSLLSLTAPLAACAAAFAMAACETKQACKTNGDGTITAELAFPTGDRSTSAVLVRQCSPGEVQVGREAEYVIEVENLTRGDLQNVSVNLENMSNMRYVSATPAPVEGPNGHVSWILPELPAKATRSIRLRAVPTGTGTASSCLTASYANMLCASTSVVSPALSLEKDASPGACTACDEISLTYVVRNSGTGSSGAPRSTGWWPFTRGPRAHLARHASRAALTAMNVSTRIIWYLTRLRQYANVCSTAA